MDVIKIAENGCAIIRGMLKICVAKIFANGKLQSKGFVRMFARSSISLHAKGSIVVGSKLRIGKNSMLTAQGGAVIIGNGVGINRDVLINSHDKITIGDNTVIAPHVCIYDHDHLFDKQHGVDKKKFKCAPISIGKNVWIGAGTIILRGSEIGDNCIIGAGCVIKGKYPAGSLVVQKRETVVSEIRDN